MSFRSVIAAVAIACFPTIAFAQAGAPSRDFIVVLNDQAGPPDFVAEQIAQSQGGRVGYIYDFVLNGFSITLPLAAVANVENRPDVAYVERDLPMSIVGQEIPTGIKRAFVDQVALDIDGVDDYRVDVDVAVIDTGIDFEHPDLNVVGGTDCTLRQGGGPFARYYCGGPGEGTGGDDNHSHGTHVAGTIGALDNGIGVVGVAPGARLWAVKVLNSQGSGYTSGIIAGIDWVVGRGDIEVANMSLGGSGVSTAYRDAIDNAVANGVVIVVAAGNSDVDANNYSPAYVPSAITVSALADFDGLEKGLAASTCRADEDDTLANFSNWGSAVDIAAAGVCILSTVPVDLDADGYAIYSGTSMAAPHVAGAAALLASGANSPINGAEVDAIRNTLVNSLNFNWTDDSGDGIHEPLLDASFPSLPSFSAVLVATGGGGGSVGNTAPVAGFNVSCTNLACDFVDTSVDDDSDPLTHAWDFGGTGVSTAANPSFTFPADGAYYVTLTVDDVTDSSSITQKVTVSSGDAGGGAPISLNVSAYKVRGFQYADLTWSGATKNVDLYRDGKSFSLDNDTGSATDTTNQKGGSSAVYQVCETGAMTTCSDMVTAVW